MRDIPAELWKLVPLFIFIIDLGRWFDAYRYSSSLELPVNRATRVLLARYNLLAISTYIYRAYAATKKAQPLSG